MYRSANAKVAGLRVGQVVTVVDGPGDIQVSGCNDRAADVVLKSLQYRVLPDGELRLTARSDSLAVRAGVQLRFKVTS